MNKPAIGQAYVRDSKLTNPDSEDQPDIAHDVRNQKCRVRRVPRL